MKGLAHSCRALLFVLRIFIALGLVALASLRADDLSGRVVLLANGGDPDSVRVARHYAQLRGVPLANIIALPMSDTETISWPEFVRTIWEPLEAELVRRKWIDAIPMALMDEVGRRKYSIWSHRISFLVVCRGVPLRIAHDPALLKAAAPLSKPAPVPTNAGAVDSELSLLAKPGYAVNGFVPNPLFHNETPSDPDSALVVKVSRLDGPTVAAAMALVDHAIAAERNGLLGRAYVDLGGIHPDGDRWLEAAAQQLVALGFDTDVDRSPATFPATARFDTPVLYFGWYAEALNGPLALPGFEFPVGAIALHIHSFSAETLRSADRHWCGPLIARGVTATVGNVYEPFLQLTHRPDLLVQALARGANFGDAVYFAQPALSWQTIALGDPLYRPFAVSLEQQLRERGRTASDLRGYVTVREMLRLEAQKKNGEALASGLAAEREHPTLAAGFALAVRQLAAGDSAGAAQSLRAFLGAEHFRSDEWALAREAARRLLECNRAADAVRVYRTIFRADDLPVAERLAWLPEAVAAANSANDATQATAWQTTREAVGPPLPAEKP